MGHRKEVQSWSFERQPFFGAFRLSYPQLQIYIPQDKAMKIRKYHLTLQCYPSRYNGEKFLKTPLIEGTVPFLRNMQMHEAFKSWLPKKLQVT